MGKLKLTALANAGLILSCGEDKLMIDGLSHDPSGNFSNLPEHLLAALFLGEKPPFCGIRHLIHTHDHPDHFSAEHIRRFCQTHPVQWLTLPRQTAVRFGDTLPVCAIELCAPQWGDTVLLPDIGAMKLTALRTRHAGEHFRDSEHYSLLVEAPGHRLLLLADSDYDAGAFERILQDRPVDTVVVNPLYINSTAGRSLLLETIRPAQILVYHIPLAGEDNTGFRSTALRDRKRYQATLPPLELLLEPLQEIILSDIRKSK